MSKLSRVTVTLPTDLLAQADQRARRLDRSRSWVVAEALRSFLAAAVVREPLAPPYAATPGLGESRSHQLRADLALTPEQRVRAAELTAREARLVRRTPRGHGVHSFERYEDYLEWKRREGI